MPKGSFIPSSISVTPALSNNSGNGVTTIDTMGEDVSAGDVLHLEADGKYHKSLATGIATMPGEVLAMANTLADEQGEILHQGYFRHDAWAFVVGSGTANLVYVSRTTPGLATQTAPAVSGDQVQVLGYCRTSGVMFFNPCLEIVEIA